MKNKAWMLLGIHKTIGKVCMNYYATTDTNVCHETDETHGLIMAQVCKKTTMY